MKRTIKVLGGGLYKPKYNGPYHNYINHYPPQQGVYDEEEVADPWKVLYGSLAVCAAGFLAWGGLRINAYTSDTYPKTNFPEAVAVRKSKEAAMGWWQHRYWKKGTPIYLPKANDSDHFGDSPAAWPVERSLAFLDDDEWWEEFESERPKGWVNILPKEFGVPELKKVSMDIAEEDEDDEDEDEDDEDEEEEEVDQSGSFLFPYNFYNPSTPLPTERKDYRRVLTVVTTGPYRETIDDEESPYKNVFAGSTAIVDPDGENPVKVTFTDDWRDCSPELLKLVRERLIWKHKDDWKNYAPPQLGSRLQTVWEENIDKLKQPQNN